MAYKLGIYMLCAICRSALSIDHAVQSIDPLIAQDMLHAGDRVTLVDVTVLRTTFLILRGIY